MINHNLDYATQDYLEKYLNKKHSRTLSRAKKETVDRIIGILDSSDKLGVLNKYNIGVDVRLYVKITERD